jgi:hypothetical protein
MRKPQLALGPRLDEILIFSRHSHEIQSRGVHAFCKLFSG